MERNIKGEGRKLSTETNNDFGLEWQFVCGEPESFARERFGKTVEFKQHHSGLHRERVVLHRSLACSHGDFGSLTSDWRMRKHADPDFSSALHGMRECAAGRFDLPRRQLAASLGLQPDGTERQLCPARRFAVEGSATTVLLTML